VPRLPIFSFRVRHGSRYLHHAFVVALLSDLFGIQSRGGCSCAGPYGHRLLHIDAEESASIYAEVARGRLGIKPGWTRVSLCYLTSDTVLEYVLAAVELVASHGHRLLEEYHFEPESGLWRHRDAPEPVATDLARLFDAPPVPAVLPLDPQSLDGYLEQAREILLAGPDSIADGMTGLTPEFEELRRFHLPPRCTQP
jgi:hypothetical protein